VVRKDLDETEVIWRVAGTCCSSEGREINCESERMEGK